MAPKFSRTTIPDLRNAAAAAAAVLERARLHLDDGRVSEGTACLDRLKHFAAEYPVSPCAWSDIHRYAALARAYLASTEGRFDDAISTLMNLHCEAEAAGSYYFALRVATLQSILRLKVNKAAEALGAFGRVLNLAASAGLYRTILDEGVEAGLLLTAFHDSVERTGRWRELMPFIDKLIEGWRSRYGSESLQMPGSSLAGTLSNREGDILKFIAQGLSNKEIAKTLAIAARSSGG
jgi:LuxR family maltose regulon positive regulatory protein